jgi:hypothetical protein
MMSRQEEKGDEISIPRSVLGSGYKMAKFCSAILPSYSQLEPGSSHRIRKGKI